MITSSQFETKELHGQLDVLVTKYNHQIMRRHLRNPRDYYNPFALGLYLKAVDLVIADVIYGYDLRYALSRNFTDHMLNYLVIALMATKVAQRFGLVSAEQVAYHGKA